jgi:hypothetical protein
MTNACDEANLSDAGGGGARRRRPALTLYWAFTLLPKIYCNATGCPTDTSLHLPNLVAAVALRWTTIASSSYDLVTWRG